MPKVQISHTWYVCPTVPPDKRALLFPQVSDWGNININITSILISKLDFNISHCPSWQESSSSPRSQWWRRRGEGRGSRPRTQSSQSCGSASPAIWPLDILIYVLQYWYWYKYWYVNICPRYWYHWYSMNIIHCWVVFTDLSFCPFLRTVDKCAG